MKSKLKHPPTKQAKTQKREQAKRCALTKELIFIAGCLGTYVAICAVLFVIALKY